MLAPSIDPSDALDRLPKDGDDDDGEEAASDDADEKAATGSLNEPLEPGSGPPDIDRILRKVREVQNQDVQGNDKSDFIAAARRAAQAAAAEVETVSGSGLRKRRGGLAALLKAQRRPILLAVGAVLLAVMSWPLASALLKRPDSPAAVSAKANVAPAAKSKVKIASAAKPGISDEKTGATAAGNEALPKVRSVDGNGADDRTAVKTPAAQATKPATVADATKPGAVADAVKPAPASAAGTGPHEPSPVAAAPSPSSPASQTAGQADTAAAPAPAPKAGTPASASAAASGDNGAAGDVAASGPAALAADAASAATEATSLVHAVPEVPASIGPQSLKTAAEKGDPKALYEIATFYTEGRGVPADLGAAARWFQAAAERGLAPAQYRLANLYEKGVGVDRDVAKARAWYRKSAAEGNVSAMHNLAVLDAMGNGGKPDYDAAAEWFRKAAEHGVKDSQFNLAILYAQGRGVPRDLSQSYKWFAVAAAAGDGDATRKRDEVAAALDAADLKKARAAASDWKPTPVDPAANAVAVPPEWSGTDTRTASVDMSKAIRNIQAILDNNGFDAGKPDGIMGAKTRSAIKAFQKSVGAEPTGEVTDALIKKLLDLNRQPKAGQNS